MLVRATAVALAVLLVPVIPAQANHTQLADTKRKIADAKSKLSRIIHDDQAVLSVLSDINRDLNAERSALSEARARLDKINVLISTEERKLARLKRRTKLRQAVIAARARALYMGGGNQPGTQSLGSIDEYLDRQGLIGFVASYDKQVLEDMAHLKDEARRTTEALAIQRRAAREKTQEIAERVEVVAELAATQRAAHAKLSSQAQAYRNEIAALEAEQRRIQALIYQRASSGSVNTGGSSALGFAWPIRGMVTSPYGPRWGGFHTGIDIDCRTGDGIGASKAGKVIAAEWGGGYGYMVLIDHGGGYTTLYAHLSRFYVGRGARVNQHQRIGACGATGNATGDHLHFEVRVNGQHRNPRNYLP